jgi:hypothetical protein
MMRGDVILFRRAELGRTIEAWCLRRVALFCRLFDI